MGPGAAIEGTACEEWLMGWSRASEVPRGGTGGISSGTGCRPRRMVAGGWRQRLATFPPASAMQMRRAVPGSGRCVGTVLSHSWFRHIGKAAFSFAHCSLHFAWRENAVLHCSNFRHMGKRLSTIRN